MFEEKAKASSICAECDGSCCQRFERSIVNLTFHEIDKIRKVTGLPVSVIARYGKTEKKWFKEIKDEPDTKAMFNGERSVFLRNKDRKCIFLTAAGCSLPHSAKPITCRFFPLWYWKKKGRREVYLADEHMEHCLMWERLKGKKLAEIIAEIGETKQSLNEMIADYEAELKAFKKYKALLEGNRIEKVMQWMEADGVL